jgi:hypothetical protein
MLHKRIFLIVLTGMAVMLVWFAAATPALAHESTTIGPYTLVVGWVNEPPIVGERNAVLLIVTNTETGAAVSGVEASLDAELVYGGKTFRANLNPSPTPGEYTLDLIPTIKGVYNLHLFGTIGNTEVELTLEPEEVFGADRLQFPESQPDPLDLEATITTLEEQVQQAQTLAFVGIAVGILGLGVGVMSLLRKR